MEPGPHAARIVVDEVEVTEESAIFAARHKSEVRVIAAVGEGTGRTWADTGVVFTLSTATRRAPVKSAVISMGTSDLVVLFMIFSLWRRGAALSNARGRRRDDHIGHTGNGDVKGIHDSGAGRRNGLFIDD